IFVFFVVLDFLLNFETAGLEPHFPLFPIPLSSPLNFALAIPPLLRVPLFPPVPTSLIFCSVFLLQCGQYLFTVFGNFILNYEREKWFLKVIKWPCPGSNWGVV